MPPGESLARAAARDEPALSGAVPGDARRIRFAVRPNRADSINAFHPDIQSPSARSWTVGFQRAIASNMAVEARYVGTRGVNQWSTLNYNERNLIENGFFDEFKLAMANLQANNAAGGARAGSFAYFGPGTGTTPLPIYLAYLERPDATPPIRRRTPADATWTNTDADRTAWCAPIPSAGQLRGSDLDGDAAAPQQLPRSRAGPAGQLLRRQSARRPGERDRQRRVQRLPRAAARAAAPAVARLVMVNASYQYALEGGSAFLGFHFGRAIEPDQPTSVTRSRASGTGPCRSATASASAATCTRSSTAIVGGWQFNGAGRIQARMMNFGNVRLVGMTEDEAQKLYKFDIRIDPANGLPTAVHVARRRDPEYAAGVQHQRDHADRLLRSRRARGPVLRAGQQRRLHPAEGRATARRARCYPRAVLHALRHRRDEDGSRSAAARTSSSVSTC